MLICTKECTIFYSLSYYLQSNCCITLIAYSSQITIIRWSNMAFCWQFCWPVVDKLRWRDVILLIGPAYFPAISSMLVQRPCPPCANMTYLIGLIHFVQKGTNLRATTVSFHFFLSFAGFFFLPRSRSFQLFLVRCVVLCARCSLVFHVFDVPEGSILVTVL